MLKNSKGICMKKLSLICLSLVLIMTVSVMTAQAKEKSREEIASAKLNLQQEAQLSKEELKAKVKDLAEVISSKVTGIDMKIENPDIELVNRILS